MAECFEKVANYAGAVEYGCDMHTKSCMILFQHHAAIASSNQKPSVSFFGECGGESHPFAKVLQRADERRPRGNGILELQGRLRPNADDVDSVSGFGAEHRAWCVLIMQLQVYF